MYIFIFLFTFTFYIITLVPTIYFGDSAEFATTTYLLDIPHPPSYPLYNLLGKLFNYLPLCEPAARINLFSAFCASLTSVFIYFIIMNLPINIKKNLRITLGIITSLTFGFSYTFYLNSIKSEVYTLYLLLFSLILYLVLNFDRIKDIRLFYLLVFVFAISLSNHPLILLSLTSLIYFIVTSVKKVFTIKNIIIIAFIMILPSSIYWYLPLRSAKEVKINWGRPQLIKGFKYIILLEEQSELFIEVLPKKAEEKPVIKKSITDRLSPKVMIGYLFILSLPLYFIFLLNSKKDYSNYKKFAIFLWLFLFVLFSLIPIYPIYRMNLPFYIKKEFLMIAFDLYNIIEYCLIWLVILFIILFSLKKENRKQLISIILILTGIVTIFTYGYLLKYTPGYEEGKFSHLIYLKFFIKQFTIYYFILGLIGILYFLYHHFRLFSLFYFLFLSFSTLIILLIYPEYLPALQERFCLPAYLIFSIFITFGIKFIIDYLTYFFKNKYFTYILLLVFISLSFIPFITKFKELNKSNYYFADYYVQDIVNTLPKDAVLLSKGIHTTFSLWYITFVKKKREDVSIIFIDALGEDWYTDNLINNSKINLLGIKYLTRKKGYKKGPYIERIINNNINIRPIYYAGSEFFIPEGIKRDTVIPEGILFKIIKKPRKELTYQEIKRGEELLRKIYKFTSLPVENIDYFSEQILSLYSSAYSKLAGVYLDMNEIQLAIDILNEGINHNPNSTLLREQLKIYSYILDKHQK